MPLNNSKSSIAASRARLRIEGLIQTFLDLPSNRSEETVRRSRDNNAGFQVRNFAGNINKYATFGNSSNSNIVGP